MEDYTKTVQERSQEGAQAAKGREGFATGLGVLAATLGSAVGLGNIWKFPSLTGINGGATFILVYLLSTLLVGLPVMIAEIVIGRTARADAITTLRKLAPGRSPWWLVGAAGALAAFLILAFYTEVAGWVFAYIFKSMAGQTVSMDPQITSQAFTQLITNPVQSLLWQWFVLLIIGGILMLGVTKGIEQTTKKLMPVLFLLLIVLVVRSLTLTGAAQGLTFLFKPDFSRLSAGMILAAMGLSFFKLSVGMGTMITYGSYFREDQNIFKTTLSVMLADLTVSLLAGMAIFPAVFTFGFKPEVGPSLLFVTIPAIFASLPLGSVFVVMFFLLAAIAATTAMLSLFEVPIAFLNERAGLSRAMATVATVIPLGLIGSTAALSNSLLANFKLFGMTMFDLFDFATSNVLLPIGGLLLAVFVGWVWGKRSLDQGLSNNGVLKNQTLVRSYRFIVRFVTPLLILLILLNGLKIIQF